LGAAALFLAAAYFLLIQAMRAGDMSVVAPFRYSGLIFALLIGYVVWGEVPNLLTWLGIVLLVGAGLAILHSERRRHQAAHQAMSEAPATD
jgi:drug/metabolite transporter (DMT)-like permease